MSKWVNEATTQPFPWAFPIIIYLVPKLQFGNAIAVETLFQVFLLNTRPSLLKPNHSRHQPIVTFFKIVRTLYRISFHSELSSRSSDTTPSPLRGATPP